MIDTVDIIKREGARQTESFAREKLHASILASCLSARAPEGEASKVADDICKEVIKWSMGKPEITSADIRRVASGLLETFQPEAAYLYKNHRLVI